MSIASVGIDIGKLTFHLVALDEHGKVIVRKRFSRKQLLAYTALLGVKKTDATVIMKPRPSYDTCTNEV